MRTTDAIPVSYIQVLIEQDKRLIEEYGGIQDFEALIDKWRKEHDKTD